MASNGTFKSIDIGDHCWITPAFSTTKQIVHIPRADGVIMRNMGGGSRTYTVTAWTIKGTKTSLEQYFDSLITSFGNTIGELIINSHSYGQCYFVRISPGTDHPKYNVFTLTFIKSL